MALAARKHRHWVNCGPPTKKSDGEENMTRVHKSANTEKFPSATTSRNIAKRHFNATQTLINNFPRFMSKNQFPFSER